MLKWLRKYNTWILVIGGVLLMIAFLMPNAIQEFGRRRMSGPVMRLAGQKISMEDYAHSALEYDAIAGLMGNRQVLERVFGIDSADHWVMLTREAEKAGYVGGVEDGRDAVSLLLHDLYLFFMQARGITADPAQIDLQVQTDLPNVLAKVPVAAAQTRLTEDQVFRALAKMRGVIRMRNSYYTSPRFSDRRLIAGVKRLADQATVDLVFVPPERVITDQTPKPTEAEIQAQFDRLKDTAPSTSELGVGYKLPARVKLSWLVVSKDAVAASVTPDPVEVAKRLLKMYGNTLPTGSDGDTARTRIENDIKAETTTKVLQTLDQSIRGEIEKATRKLDPDGEYKRLPEGWTPPDLNAIATGAASHVAELLHVNVPAPIVQSRTDWVYPDTINSLPAISSSKLKRGTQERKFDEVAFGTREISGANDLVLQVGVPYGESLADTQGNHYYFMVLDARKESPPDTLAEVRDRIVKDIQRVNAYEELKKQIDTYRQLAIDKGLDAVAKAPDGVTGPAAIPLNVQKDVRVDGMRVLPQSPILDFEGFRDAVREAAGKLDPTSDISKADPALRTVVVPSPKGLGLIVARITAVAPMTVERFRNQQDGMISALQRQELQLTDGSPDPFSLSQMEKRLNVEYLDGRERNKGKDKNVAAKSE